jgi:hypothetical protein
METNFKLRLLTWNANGIIPNKLELQAALNIHNIDIAMISESHLTLTKSIKILGYKVYQSNHPDSTAHAGSVILVKNNLTHSLLPSFSETYLQATSILVSVNKHLNLSFSSIYCPPGPKINSNNFINYFESLGKYFIVAGDLNAKHSSWGCLSTNPRDRILYNSINNSNIKIIPPSNPTIGQHIKTSTQISSISLSQEYQVTSLLLSPTLTICYPTTHQSYSTSKFPVQTPPKILKILEK